MAGRFGQEAMKFFRRWKSREEPDTNRLPIKSEICSARRVKKLPWVLFDMVYWVYRNKNKSGLGPCFAWICPFSRIGIFRTTLRFSRNPYPYSNPETGRMTVSTRSDNGIFARVIALLKQYLFIFTPLNVDCIIPSKLQYQIQPFARLNVYDN